MRRAWAFIAFAVLVAGCGGGTSKLDLNGRAGAKITHAADVSVPSTVLGLTVAPEDVSKAVADQQRTYIDSLVLYGLRTGKLLQATFQVSRFIPGTKYTTTKFDLSMVDQIGSGTPVTLSIDGQTVYLSTGNGQQIDVWFKGAYFFVLASRTDYDTPRALLRALLAVNP